MCPSLLAAFIEVLILKFCKHILSLLYVMHVHLISSFLFVKYAQEKICSPLTVFSYLTL
jgi:hypothetical protein